MAKQNKTPQTTPTGTNLAKDVNPDQTNRGSFFANQGVGNTNQEQGKEELPIVDSTKLPANTKKTEGEAQAPITESTKIVEASLKTGIKLDTIPDDEKNLGIDVSSEQLISQQKDRNKKVSQFTKANAEKLPEVEAFAPSNTGTPVPESLRKYELDYASQHPQVLKEYGSSNNVPLELQKKIVGKIVNPSLASEDEKKEYIQKNGLDEIGYNPKTELFKKVSEGITGSKFLYDVSQKTNAYQKQITDTGVFDKVSKLKTESESLQKFYDEVILKQRDELAKNPDIISFNQKSKELEELTKSLSTIQQDEKIKQFETLSEDYNKTKQEYDTLVSLNNTETKTEEQDKVLLDLQSKLSEIESNDLYKSYLDKSDETINNYIESGNKLSGLKQELDLLKQKTTEIISFYEKDKNELKYKEGIEKQKKSAKDITSMLDKSFLAQLVKTKGEEALNNPAVVQDSIIKAVNSFKYNELTKAGFVPQIDKKAKPEFIELVTSQTFQYGTSEDKKILLNEYYSTHKPAGQTKQAFFDLNRKYITEPLDIVIIKAQAIELQAQSRLRKAINGVPYKDNVRDFNFEKNILGIANVLETIPHFNQSKEQAYASLSDLIVERINKIPVEKYGILRDFIKGLKASEFKQWMPVLGGLVSADEQKMIYDAYKAVENNIESPEQKRLYETLNYFNTVSSRYTPSLSFSVGKDMTPMLVKFAGEMSLLSGISKGVSVAISETETAGWIGRQFIKASEIVLEKDATAQEIGLTAKYLSKTLSYPTGLVLKAGIGANTIGIGDVTASTYQKITAVGMSQLDPETNQVKDYKAQEAQFEDFNRAYIKSALQQSNFFVMGEYAKPLEHLTSTALSKVTARFQSALKYSPQTKRFIDIVKNPEIFKVNSISSIYPKLKELARYMTFKSGVFSYSHLNSAPLQTFSFVMVDHVNNLIDDAFGNQRSVNMSEDGYLKHKFIETVAMSTPMIGVSIGLGGLSMTFRGFQKFRTEGFKLDDIDRQFLNLDNIKANSLFPYSSMKRARLISFQSILKDIVNFKGNLHESDSKLTELTEEIERLASAREIKLARLAELMLSRRVSYDFNNETGIHFKDYFESFEKQSKDVKAVIEGSKLEGIVDKQVIEKVKETVTDEVLLDELNHLELADIEYKRQKEQKLIADNITFSDFYVREQKKLDRIGNALMDYIGNGGSINFREIGEMIANTVMSSFKFDEVNELKKRAEDIYIKNQGVRVENIIFTPDGLKTAYTDVKIEEVKERVENAQKQSTSGIFANSDTPIRITKGLSDKDGVDMDLRVNKDGEVRLNPETNPESFIKFVVSEITHMNEKARNAVMLTLSKNTSLTFEQRYDLLSRIHRRFADDLGDNKMKPRQAMTIMADLNQALKENGITFAVDEKGSVPTNGILAYKFFKGNFNYDSEARKFFLTQEEWHKAKDFLEAMKNYDRLISTDRITSLENRLITDSEYVYDYEEEDKEELQKAQQQGYKESPKKLSKKDIVEYLKELKKNKNISRGEFNAVVQVLSNLTRNIVRMGYKDTEREALELLVPIRQLDINFKEGNKRLTNPDILLQDKSVQQEFGGFLNHTYSRLEDAIKMTKIEKGTGEEWLKAISKASESTGGFSKDEMKWTGLENYLLDRIEEVDGEKIPAPIIKKEQVLKEFRKRLDKIKPKVKVLDVNNRKIIEGLERQNWLQTYTFLKYKTKLIEAVGNTNLIDIYNRKIDALRRDRQENLDKIKQLEERQSKYNKGSQWDYVTQIGGDGYKEHVFYIENVEPYGENDNVHFGDKTEENGALFWVRSSEYTNEHGERVILIEEIQSNRNQELSKTIAENKVIEDSKTGKNELKIYNEKDPKANSFGGKLNFYFELPETGKAIVLDNKKRGVICAAARFIYKNENPDNKSNTANEYQKNELDYQDNDTRIDYLKKALDEHLKNNKEVIGELSNQFEGNNWKNLASKYIVHYAIQNGIDKIELTGSKTQVKRGGEESGHVQFYDKTIPDIFKKLGLKQGETKDTGTGELYKAYYINGKEVTEEWSAEKAILDNINNNQVTYAGIEGILDNFDFSKNEAIENYKTRIQSIVDTISKIENGKTKYKEGYTNELIRDKLKLEKELREIESAELTSEVQALKSGNTHTFEITQDTKRKLERGIALFQKEETSGIKGLFNPAENIILILKKGDISTVMHELGHTFKFILERAADEGNSKAQSHLKTFNNFVNGKEGKSWAQENGIDINDKYKYENELFARSFERYLAEGSYSGIKDGNYRNLLNDFKDFLKQIYEDIKSGILNIKLNNEMRDMFEALIGNKIDINNDLMTYINQKFGRFSQRTNVTKEDMMALLDEAEKRTDPENREQAMALLHRIFTQYKNQYIGQRYKGNSRLINPALRQLLKTPKHNVIEMYRKDIANFENIIDNARYRFTFQQMMNTRKRAVQQFMQSKNDNIQFWSKIRELANVDIHSIESQESMENYIKILKLKPKDTGVEQLSKMAEKYIEASDNYRISKLSDKLNKEMEELRLTQEGQTNLISKQEVSDRGLDETRKLRNERIKSTRDYAVNIADVKITNGNLITDFFSLDVSDLTDAELNQYNGLLTEVIRAGKAFNFSNDFVQFTTDVKVRQANELIENSLSRHWIDTMARLNNRLSNNIPILRHVTSRLLNPFGYGMAENYNLKDYLNFYDGIQNDYSGVFVKTVFSPLEEAHDKHRAILSDVFTKINKYRIGENSIKEGAFNAIGINWLLSQKPDIKITDKFFERKTNPETNETTSLIEELGLNIDDIESMRGMTLKKDEFFEKDNSGQWIEKQNVDKERKQIYDAILNNRMQYIKDSIMVTFGEKPDWMPQDEFESHLKRQMGNPLFLISNLHLIKDGNVSNFMKDFWSPVLHKRKLLLDATGAKSVRDFVDNPKLSDSKQNEFKAIGISIFDQLNNGEFSDGITMKSMSDNFTADNANEFEDIANYAPIIRNVSTSIDNSMALETVPGAITDADGKWGIRTGINISNQFIKTRSEMVSTLETNAFNMIEKRFDQELFYMLQEPHRLFLKGLLNLKDGVFNNIDKRIDKDGNESNEDINQRSANYIKNLVSLYYRRNMSPAKLNLKDSKIVGGVHNMLQDMRIVMLAPLRSSLAQITSTVMSQENMFGNIDTRLKHMSQGYSDLFSDSDVKTEFIRKYAPEVYNRGLTDYDLGANKEGVYLGSLLSRYFANDFDSEKGKLSGFLQSLKNNKIATEKALIPMVYFDRAAARATFYASYRNYLEHYGIQLDWSKPDMDAVNYAVSVVRKTQNTDNELYKSGVLSGLSTQEGGKGFFDRIEDKDGKDAVGELFRQQYYNFKSFSLADQNNIAIKFIKALHDEKVNPDLLYDAIKSIGYNMIGKMMYQYIKSASKVFMVGLGMNIAYLQGMGYLGDGDDDSLIKELLKGNTDQAKTKVKMSGKRAYNNAKQIFEDELYAPESHKNPISEGLIFNAVKALMSEFQVNELSGTVMANMFKAANENMLDVNQTIGERYDKLYSLSDDADVMSMFSKVTGVSLVYGSGGEPNSEIQNVYDVAKSIANQTPEDVTYNDMSSVFFFLSELFGYRLFGRLPLSYPSIKKWLEDTDKFNREHKKEAGQDLHVVDESSDNTDENNTEEED